jgi:hypothetical protein
LSISQFKKCCHQLYQIENRYKTRGKIPVSLNLYIAAFSITGKMPVPQRRVNFLVGWAGDPAPKRLIENSATYELKPTFALSQGFKPLAD